MRGKRPKPHTLRLISTRPDKLKRQAAKRAPEPTHDIGDPPAWLSQRQAATWRHVVEHAALGQLKAVDGPVLACFCIASDMHREAAERLEAEGLLTDGRDSGRVKNPLTTIMSQSAVAMMRAAAELGLTPIARVRLAVRDREDGLPDDAYDI